MLNINIELRNPNAKLPTKANSTDGGFDLSSVSMTHTDTYIEYDTGISVEIPIGYVGLVFPRSSISKYDLVLANSVGVIDHGYNGTIKFRFKLIDQQSGLVVLSKYAIGDRIGQLIIIPIPDVQLNIVDSISGNRSGFGSSGV